MENVLINKAAQIQRCIKRIHEEYDGAEEELESNQTKQDAVILNLQRACETSIDMATYIVKKKKLGIPQSGRDAFRFLSNDNVIPKELGEELEKMVGFRNIAIHNYSDINLEVIHSIIKNKLENILRFSEIVLKDAI